MKTSSIQSILPILAVCILTPLTSQAGEPSKTPVPETAEIPGDPFAAAIRPISSPTLFDLALPRTQIHPVFMYQRLPDSIDTALGSLSLDGDFFLYALQLEYAFNDRLSLIALKDGYIDFNPDSTLTETEGWANLAAGLKWAFLYQPENALAASLSVQVEAPTGNEDVFQGTGDGAIIPTISGLKLFDRLQLADSLGVRIPFDSDAESTDLFASVHASYALTDWFSPVVELNYFRVLDEGDGGTRFNTHVGGAVPAVAEFEGGDLISLGALNADENPDILTLALGFRLRPSEKTSVGFAYEFPLTDEEANLMESRITVDCTITF